MKNLMNFGLRVPNATRLPHKESHLHHYSLPMTNASSCGSHCQKEMIEKKLQSTHHAAPTNALLTAMVVLSHQLPLKQYYGGLAKGRASDSHLSKAADDVNVAIPDARIRSYNYHDGLFHEDAMRTQHGGAGGFLCCPHEGRWQGMNLPIGYCCCADGPFL